MKIWSYWATLGWAVLAFLLGQFIALAAVAWLRAGDLNSLFTTPYDGVVVTLFILISNPITIAVIAVAVRLARAGQVDYLALTWPRARDVTVGVIWLIGLIALYDALLYLSGRSGPSSFELQAYTTAAGEGWLLPLFAALVIVGPAGEQILLSGFLFRGWARSQRSTWPAIIVISILWSGL
jgi:membrane protease YdiL (CAAX protease family)